MSTAGKLPAPDRQRLFQFRFLCRPTPKHPRFYELERVHFYVWLLDESQESAAGRATTFVSVFPLTYEPKVIGLEITDEMINNGKLDGWQVDQCVKAHQLGVQFGFFPVQGDEESHQWPL